MLSFGEFEIDVTSMQLRRDGHPVHLEPQVFDVLAHLVRHRDRLVPKEELLDVVWGSRFVSESTLTSRIKAARSALGDDGETQRWIRTVRGRGYQFVGEQQPLSPTSEDSAPRFVRGDDGVRIAYAVTGAGPPLIKAANWMTHLGYDRASPLWRHWLDALSRQHSLVRYDERGCGLSEWTVGSFTFQDWVRDLEIVAEAARVDCSPVLGISQGAAVAIAYAVRHPQRVSHLVLVGGYAAGRGRRAVSEADRAAAALDIELARVGWGQADPAFRRVFAAHFLPEGPPELWEAFDELQRRTTSADNAVRFLTEFAEVDVRDLAREVRCPTLVIHSRDDHRVPFSCAEELHTLIPGSRLVGVPSSNHLVLADEPGWPMVVDEIAAFLDVAGV